MAETLSGHLCRMGKNGCTDIEGCEYLASFDSFWFPGVRHAYHNGELEYFLKGIEVMEKEHPEIYLTWNDPINKTLKYKSLTVMLGAKVDW